MISGSVVFAHIPRTSGISITTALRDALPDLYMNTTDHRHYYARMIRAQMGAEAWDRAFRFSIIRSPWAIAASWYRLAQRELAQHGIRGNLAANPHPWARYLRRFVRDQDFGRYIHRDILGGVIGVAPGGFWRTWCCDLDGGELGVVPYRFERLRADWPEIAERCGCPGLSLRHLNSTVRKPVPWTRVLVRAVGRYCRDDVGRFGFRPPLT